MVGHKQRLRMAANREKTTLLTLRVSAQSFQRDFLAGSAFELGNVNFRSSRLHFRWFFDGLVSQCLDMSDLWA